jgi:hypothetical protein
VCKIWANNEKKEKIPGGFSIRSADESITVQVFSKYDLCKGFCSDNSGMQGTRAIEKSRGHVRLDRDFKATQSTVFDLELFASIMNDIDDLTEEQALETFKYLIVKAKSIKADIEKSNASIEKGEGKSFDLLKMLRDTNDPELTKCVFGACFEAIYGPQGFELSGIEDQKTAADTRAKKPGDLTLEKEGKSLVSIEVKDKTQDIDWDNIEKAKKILERHKDVVTFIFALESRSSVVTDIVKEMTVSKQLNEGLGDKIVIMSLHDAYRMALAMTDEESIRRRTGQFLTKAPAIKVNTRDKWVELTKS